MNRQMEAVETLYDLRIAPTADEVWSPLSSYHVEGLHRDVYQRLLRSIKAANREYAPIAAVVQGERGSGKTHLLGWIRHEIQARGGFFFYIKLVTGQDFWESATNSLVDSLYRKDEAGQEQLLYLLTGLSRKASLNEETQTAITGEHELTRAHLDTFVNGIRGLDRQVGNEAGDTARALALIASTGELAEVGKQYFDLTDDDTRSAWGLSPRARPAQRVLRDLTRLFALVGPLVFAFDQLDNLVAVSTSSIASPSSDRSQTAKRLSEDIAAGLMELREEARRTLMIVACQPGTWQKISNTALRSALDRFEELPLLGAIPDETTAAEIVSGRFRSRYESVGFIPPYPTWPISPAALAEAPDRYTARRLLLRVQEHIATCLSTGTVTELTSLAESHRDAAPSTAAPPTELDAYTELFGKLRGEADDLGPLDKAAEDRLIPELLGAGLRSLVKELGVDETRVVIETDFGGRAALHARLRYAVNEASENEIHWSFRAIAADNPRAVQTRIRDAMAEAGLVEGLPARRLILLRNTRYPTGRKTQEMRDDFVARGGLRMTIGAADLRTLSALRVMLANHSPGLDAWLRRERPASRTELFATVVRDLQQYLGAATDDEPAVVERSAQDVDRVSQIALGTTARGGRPFTVAVEQLRKHTAVVGASGSGKSVLIKHIVEQCALRGISAIVLDPGGDLGRIGDPWPSPPDGWSQDHEYQAQRYFAETEVMVWTPGLNRGRPLSFHPLPDFGPVIGDQDDFERLLASTIATLAPLAGVRGTSSRAIQQLGILQRALDRYAHDGGRAMGGFIELLAEPPAGIVNSRTSRLAVQMADTLEAVMDTDPLLGESGTPAEPGVLLTPSTGKSARISVISFVGLSGEAIPRFVSLLQASLFSWFRAHPAGDRPLGGLLVMDEAHNFVPSSTPTPSTNSTIELIRQIRKYGLGVVIAAQEPKGLSNKAVGNTANQFIGRLTAPAQIRAAEEMAQARNGVLDNLSGLTSGQFYAAGEGTAFSKIQVPLCLSHHAGPLQDNDIVERSHRNSPL